MGIEWFRDLSVTILCFVTTGVLIFAAIILYLLYRKIKTTLFQVQTLVKRVNDTVNALEGMIKPILSVHSIISGINRGFNFTKKMFKKERKTEGG